MLGTPIVSTSFPPGALPPLPPLLANLPQDEHTRLVRALELVHLGVRQVLHQPGECIAHVYFPLDALVSLLTVLSDGGAIETGFVGPDGMVGLPVLLRLPTANQRAVCQRAGLAWRLHADAFRDALSQGSELSSRLLRYTARVLFATAQTAACNWRHAVEARCARWLLTMADHDGLDGSPITQQYMAEMLGVRRATVVAVIGTLTRAGLIDHGYRMIVIRNRPGLEDAACECYRVPRGVVAPMAPEVCAGRTDDLRASEPPSGT